MMAQTYTLATCSYRAFRRDMGVPVRASLGVPKHPVPGFDPNRRVREVTPGSSYFRASAEEFDRQFYGQLDRHGVQRLMTVFEDVAKTTGQSNPTLVLLCFETIGVFPGPPESQLAKEAVQCHRRMFARWWLERTGDLVPELGSPRGEDRPTLW